MPRYVKILEEESGYLQHVQSMRRQGKKVVLEEDGDCT